MEASDATALVAAREIESVSNRLSERIRIGDERNIDSRQQFARLAQAAPPAKYSVVRYGVVEGSARMPPR